MKNPSPPCLISIDVQEGFREPYWGPRNKPEAEARIAEALAHWRAQGWPVFHVQHLSREPRSPLRPGTPGVEFMEVARPREGEPVFQKHVNSAFIGTSLEARLREQGIQCLVFVGFTSDHCVSTSVRMAANLGFEASILSDATATFDRFALDGGRIPADEVHRVSLASLHGEFAQALTLRECIARLQA